MAFEEPLPIAVQSMPRTQRAVGEEASLATTSVTAAADAATSKAPSRRYINLTGFPFPLGPFTERRTVQSELMPGKVYGFEQEQQLSGITANVRSVVFRMKDNHLLVYNPVSARPLLMPHLSLPLLP